MSPDPSLFVQPGSMVPFSRGHGVVTLPYVGRWNSTEATVTTGVTVFAPGTGIALHTHNVEETVLVLTGRATVTIDGAEYEAAAGASTWVPAGVPHCFGNAGHDELRIFWVYGGREVTRTICATGQTFEHLSEADRGATRQSSSAE